MIDDLRIQPKARTATIAAPLRHSSVGEDPGGADARFATLRVLSVALGVAVGLAVIALSFTLSREGRDLALATALYWIGLIAAFLPAGAVLTSIGVSRRDRILISLLVSLVPYAVKALHDPTMFTLGDEFAHLRDAQLLQSMHRLFLPNSLLSVTPHYPGLALVTVELNALSGLSLFASGLLAIGVARVALSLALFSIFESVSRSPRVAGIAVLLYAGNANFFFFSAQYSYESLALPLLVIVLALLLRRAEGERGAWQPRLFTVMLALSLALVVTHHLTSYALIVLLWTLWFTSRRRGERDRTLLGLALATTAASCAWLLTEATNTGSYLGYVFSRTAGAIGGVAGGHARAPFETTSGYATPVSEQAIAVLSLLFVFAVTVASLWRLRRHLLSLPEPSRFLTIGVAILFLVVVPLRALPGAWETASRSSEFLFIGVAVLMAMTLTQGLTEWQRRRRWGWLLVPAAILLVVVGGALEGFPTPLRLAQPLQVRVGQQTIVPQSYATAAWARQTLTPRLGVVADAITGRLLVTDGFDRVLTGTADGVPQLLGGTRLDPWETKILAGNRIQTLVLDDRKSSADNLAGYYFPDSAASRRAQRQLYPSAARTKFSAIWASELLDTGDIAVYDVRAGLLNPLGLDAFIARSPGCSAIPAAAFQRTARTCRAAGRLVATAPLAQTASLPGISAEVVARSAHVLHNGGIAVSVVARITDTSAEPLTGSGAATLALAATGRQLGDEAARGGSPAAARSTSVDVEPGRPAVVARTFRLAPGTASDFARAGGYLVVRLGPVPGTSSAAGRTLLIPVRATPWLEQSTRPGGQSHG